MQILLPFTLLLAFVLCTTSSFAQDCTLCATVGSQCTLTVDGVLTIPANIDLMTIEVKAWGAGGGTEAAVERRIRWLRPLRGGRRKRGCGVTCIVCGDRSRSGCFA